jgi:hypothetical protein
VRCRERERLWEEYNHALDEFSHRTDQLSPLLSDPKVFRKKAAECQAAKEKCKAHARHGLTIYKIMGAIKWANRRISKVAHVPKDHEAATRTNVAPNAN